MPAAQPLGKVGCMTFTEWAPGQRVQVVGIDVEGYLGQRRNDGRFYVFGVGAASDVEVWPVLVATSTTSVSASEGQVSGS